MKLPGKRNLGKGAPASPSAGAPEGTAAASSSPSATAQSAAEATRGDAKGRVAKAAQQAADAAKAGATNAAGSAASGSDDAAKVAKTSTSAVTAPATPTEAGASAGQDERTSSTTRSSSAGPDPLVEDAIDVPEYRGARPAGRRGAASGRDAEATGQLPRVAAREDQPLATNREQTRASQPSARPAPASSGQTATGDPREAGSSDAERASSADAAGDGATSRRESQPRDIYDIVGRARPQRIDPQGYDNPRRRVAAGDLPPADGPAGQQPANPSAPTEVIAVPRAGQSSFDVRAERAAGPQDRAGTSAAGAGRGLGAREGAAAAAMPPVGVPAAAPGSDPAPGPVPTTAFDASVLPVGDPTVDPAQSAPVDPTVDQADPAVPVAEAEPAPQRGTTDFGLFILRAGAGVLLLLHGLQTLFSFGGDSGVSALQARLGDYSYPDILALAIPGAQVAAGALLLLGLLTPLAAALGFLVSGFLALHHLRTYTGSLWPYAMNPQVYVWALFALMSLALVFTGPGRLSMDRARGWATRPRVSAGLFALLAVAGLVAAWILLGGGNPLPGRSLVR